MLSLYARFAIIASEKEKRGDEGFVISYVLLGLSLVLETAKTLWAENPDEGRMAAILESAKRYSREVEHSDENIELLEKLSRREGVFGLDSLLTGILN